MTMRGFLTILAMAAAMVIGGTWIAGPTVAESVVAAGLAASGFSASTQTITIAADPPLELLGGHADAVEIDATGVSVTGIQAGSVEITLRNVSLTDRGYEAGGSSTIVAFDPTGTPGLGLSSVSVSDGDVIVEGTMDMTRLVP